MKTSVSVRISPGLPTSASKMVNYPVDHLQTNVQKLAGFFLAPSTCALSMGMWIFANQMAFATSVSFGNKIFSKTSKCDCKVMFSLSFLNLTFIFAILIVENQDQLKIAL